MIRATTVRTFSTCQLPKVVREWFSLYILTWTCASRHNGVHLFDVSPSKSDPTLGSFVHFDLEMCFVPQRRTLFRHRNSQKWSDTDVHFILTSKCASCHNGAHFFDIATSRSGPTLRCFVHFGFEMCFAPRRCAIFHLSAQMQPRWLRTRRFTEPTFRPSGATNHRKNRTQCFVSRLSYLFAHLDLLSSDFFFFDLLFSSLLFSDSSQLCFSSVHIVESLTSKLSLYIYTQI